MCMRMTTCYASKTCLPQNDGNLTRHTYKFVHSQEWINCDSSKNLDSKKWIRSDSRSNLKKSNTAVQEYITWTQIVQCKYYGFSDYKPITGTIVTPEQTLAVPNGLQKTIYTAFQEVKPLVGTEVHSDEDVKRILSLKGQIQAARNIEKGKFPEIRRLTDRIGVPVMDNGRKRKALIEPRTTTE